MSSFVQKIQNMGIKWKMAVLFTLFGILPAVILFSIFMIAQKDYKADRVKPLLDTAISIGDVIDRNLFERYGDVQAFGLNTAAQDQMNWKNPVEGNPLIRAMNGYMESYGIYKLMMLVDLDGHVLATNTVKANGDELSGTADLYAMNFSKKQWFKNVKSERYLEGKGLTGTAVEQPYSSDIVADLYGDDSFVLSFAAPVYNDKGDKIAIWVNFADFSLVEDIVKAFRQQFVAQGVRSGEITVLDDKGRVIVDMYSASLTSGVEYKRDLNVIGQFNLAEKLPVAAKAVAGESGVEKAFHARHSIWQVAGYAKTKGAYNYPGLGWSVLVRADEAELLTAIQNVVVEILVALVICLAVVVLAGLWVGGKTALPLLSLRSWAYAIAEGKKVDMQSNRQDEIGDLIRSFEPVGEKAMIMGSALDGLRNNVIIASNDDVIEYVNKATVENLTKLSADIRQQFPDFSVDKVLGGSIHRFHKNPDRIRNVLRDLKPGQVHSTDISIGTLTLSLNVGGIFDAAGARLGSYAEWSDITQQKIDSRQSNIMNSTMEGLGSNVLIADENDALTYANKASINSLTKLTDAIKETFPDFSVAKLMGKSIHDFHKNPDRIRQILNALRPGQQHRAKITIGNIILALNAGGVFDEKGNRMGTYVEWSDITAQEAREKAEKEAAAVKERIEKEINNVANMINDATRDIAQGNVNLSERTEAQAASIEETTATMQQITERVNEGATSAKEALSLSNSAREVADRGGRVVKDAIQAMEEISTSSSKIADIIGVIDEIAFQTNLLALNAAVEAARAGDQGRGFAVVASEVRTLAGRSAKAAKEIKDLINESVGKVKAGTEQVNETGECLNDIIMNVQQVAEMVNEISEGSQEQAISIAEINKSVTQMDSFTQQNAALVEEAASASRSLEEQANNLVAIINGETTASTSSASAKIQTYKPETQKVASSKPKEAKKANGKANGCPEYQPMDDDQAWMDA